jgi:tetratricopeptide (TPR) repeat protein
MDDFIRKPFRASQIYECLHRQLGIQFLYADIDTWMVLADTEMSRKRYAKVEKAYRKVLEMDPNFIKAWMGLGRVYSLNQALGQGLRLNTRQCITGNYFKRTCLS